MDSADEKSTKPNDTVRMIEPPILATVVDPDELPGDVPILATLSDSPPVSLAWPKPKPHPASGYYPEKVYGVTRRFSLATVMLMMAGASVILAVMNAFDIHPAISGGFLLLCVATAIGQMLLFGGKQPRMASLIVGEVFSVVASFIGVAVFFDGPSRQRPAAMIFFVFFGAIIGPVLGYLAGGLVAGVLLVMDLTELKLARWRRVREPDDDPWPEPTNPEKTGKPPAAGKALM